MNISIISASVSLDRKSHRVALYFKKYLEENNLAEANIIDLKEYNFLLPLVRFLLVLLADHK